MEYHHNDTHEESKGMDNANSLKLIWGQVGGKDWKKRGLSFLFSPGPFCISRIPLCSQTGRLKGGLERVLLPQRKGGSGTDASSLFMK